jgi:hypothetical protein
MSPSSSDNELYCGYFIASFHLSHFYPVGGEGHWWVEADDAIWPLVWAHGVDDPPVVTVYMEVKGDLQPNVAKELTSPEGDHIRVPPRGATSTKLVVSHIQTIRPVPFDDFNRLAGISAA